MELTARTLDAFILPRFDAHQGEYVAPHDERLAYVTGFTGSAGMAMFLIHIWNKKECSTDRLCYLLYRRIKCV
ncbi:hypothetical protein, partial [Klebsiella pneumoniae]|uniref:hypothetical protein n=1 Tax=Klebsiella pneumoniae TaxID=573 RepID=UPI00210DA79A